MIPHQSQTLSRENRIEWLIQVFSMRGILLSSPQCDGQDRACPPRHPSPLLPRPPSIGAMPQTSRTRWCRSILRDHPAMSSHPEGLCAPPPSPAQDPTRTPHHATGRCLSEDSHSNLHLRKRVFASVSLAGARCRRSCKRYALRSNKGNFSMLGGSEKQRPQTAGGAQRRRRRR